MLEILLEYCISTGIEPTLDFIFYLKRGSTIEDTLRESKNILYFLHITKELQLTHNDTKKYLQKLNGDFSKENILLTISKDT
jgi:hypothetical protein